MQRRHKKTNVSQRHNKCSLFAFLSTDIKFTFHCLVLSLMSDLQTYENSEEVTQSGNFYILLFCNNNVVHDCLHYELCSICISIFCNFKHYF